MCLIWKTITHIIRKLKQLKIQQMIEGLPKDARLRSAETLAWEWGPSAEKSMTVSNTSSFCHLPWHLLQRPTEGKVTPCQRCVGWVLVQRASLCQIWEFQHYFAHPQPACGLLFKATYLCTGLCIHCMPRYSSIPVYFLGTCREVAALD